MSQVSIIDIEGNHPQIPTRFDANIGFAIPLGNVLEIFGDTQLAGTSPVHTVGIGNNITTYVQLSQAIAAPNSANVGLSAFNSAQFSVDAAGFVSLMGGGLAIDSVAVQTGTSPVVPDATGLITFNGAVANAGINPVRSNGTGPNTYALEVQISQAVGAGNVNTIGLSNFDSGAFTVSAAGFVSLSGTAVGRTITGNSGGALSPTAGNWNIFAAAVAAGTTPAATAGAVSTLTVNIQRTQAIASTNAANVGLAAFNSSEFSVDANGFVSLSGSGGFTWNDVSGAFSPLKENGYFITATANGTLPAAPSQGDTIQFFVDTTQFLTITASGTQIIRLGTLVSSAGGTAISTLQGDSLTLVYRTSDTCWCSIAGFSGTWLMA